MKIYFANLRYLLSVHITGILFFMLFRVLLLLSNTQYFSNEDSLYNTLVSLLIGLRFDNAVACYIILVPLIIVTLTSLLGVFNRIVKRVVNIYFQIFYVLSFAILAANIPYFKYFFTHLNSSIFNWLGYTGTTVKMMLGEVSYIIYFIVFLLASFFFIRITNAFLKKLNQNTEKQTIRSRIVSLPLSCILIGLSILGLRGGYRVSPIRVSASYFCQDPFFNQVGNNPVFNLTRSTLDSMQESNKAIVLMDNQTAVNNVKKYLSVSSSHISESGSIFERVVKADTTEKKRPNIVLIFMESMSADLMGRHGNPNNPTPFLDSLSRVSYYFDRFYSAGNHTNQGVYSTLYSYPSILRRNAMKNSIIPQYYGLPNILRENSYQTLFFLPHEAQYDNMNGFLITNGFEEIHSEENYPIDKIANCWGVSDDYLFDYSIPVLNEKAKSDNPFFGVILTVSNHPPYVIPEWFKPRNSDVEYQIVEYADASIRAFFETAKKQPWFENTIFVLVADHGKMLGDPIYEIPQSFNHVPLIIYSPQLQPQTISSLGGQIDIAPTLLGLLNIEYQNTSLGVDLMKQTRPCMYFTTDNAIGCLDSSYLYIYRPNDKMEFLYHYSDLSRKNESAEKPERVNKLKDYSWSMFQATQYATDSILNNKAKIQ